MEREADPTVSANRPIAEAAVSTTWVERKRLFRGRSVIDLGEALTAHPSSVLFKAAGGSASVRNYTLEDVVLDADTLVLSKDGRTIPETSYFAPRQDNAPAPLLRLDTDDVLVMGFNNAHRGYQHWLTQCLPAIDWSLRQAGTRDVTLLLPALMPWQEDYLALLGYAGVRRLTPEAGSRYHLRRLEFSEFLNGSASFEVSLGLAGTLRRIMDATPPRPSPDRILYIRDARPYYGSITNEAAVIALLHQHGVSIVLPERLGVVERINLFRNADAVIGPMGQYMADVVFCRPGALLWEWMPRHHQNQMFNRLAQAAEVDYWGDLFESAANPGAPGDWEVDLGVLSRRLTVLSGRRVPPAAERIDTDRDTNGPALDELLMGFESLGDSCEFGFVQRIAGAEPLGLFRFNGIYTPPEFRLEKLVAALQRRLAGLGEPGTITVAAEGVPGQRELMVRDSVYEFYYHTGISEGAVEPAIQAQRETTRLHFLRRKLLEDLASGEKISVWKSSASSRTEQLWPLLDMLRVLGPNTLLWVVPADADHPAGMVEVLEPDFFKGYVQRFAPDNHAADIDEPSWLAVCAAAAALRSAGEPAAVRAPLKIGDAAEAQVFIEQQASFEARCVITLGDALAAHANGAAFSPLTTTLTIRNYTLRNVVLDGASLRLLKDGAIIQETEYFTPPFDPRHLPLTPLDENEVLIFGTNNQHWGYQHWLTQCLPAIDWSLRQARPRKVRLLLPDLQPWQEDLLRLLGHADVPRLRPQPDARYHLPQVEFSDFIHGINSFGISQAVLDTIRRILAAVPAQPPGDKLLYIRNTAPYYGGIGNEDAVIALLRQHGVAIVEPETLTTVERINLFRDADVVIGPLGPYLADVLFCRPRALLWEWMPRHHQNHAFCCLAQAAAVDYWGDLFETADEPQRPGEWQVDLAIVAQRLAVLTARTAPLAEPTPPDVPQHAVSAMDYLARRSTSRAEMAMAEKSPVWPFQRWFSGR